MVTLVATVAEPDPEPSGPAHTEWHVLLGGIQQPLLRPVDITVETELLATQKPPRIDMLLLRRKGKFWTPEQQDRLPDGIRQSYANHILCEFKYTQSVNQTSLLQALLYDYLYRSSRHLKRQAVQTFVVSARTPQRTLLAQFGYVASGLPGVYQSQHQFVSEIDLVVLNELSVEPHNVFFKCFASQKRQRNAAFAVINRLKLWNWSEELWATVSGLQTVFQRLEGDEMKAPVLTPEYLRELGKGMREQIIATLSLEERLAGLAPEDRLAGLAPEERLAGLAPEVIEAYLRKQRTERKSGRTAKAKSAQRKPKKTKILPS